MRRILMILVIFITGFIAVSAQAVTDSTRTQLPHKNIRMVILNKNTSENKLNFNSDYYKYNAFFCRLEDKMYAKTKKNIRFRLGSVDYVDKLESK